MRNVAVCLLFSSAALLAQTADRVYFRAVMLPTSEVPATSFNGTGVADIIAHVVRDNTGQVISGTVDFLVRVNFPADDSATGLHIHNGAAGVAGPVVINTGLSAANAKTIKAGGDTVHLPAQVTTDNTTALTALRGLLTDPASYYVNIHTPAFPGGAIRGQLVPAVGTVLMGQMTAANEVPPPGVNATGTAIVVAFATMDSKGALLSGETYQQTDYTMDDRGTFTGFHIHPGLAGVNGPVGISSGIPSGTAIDPSGTGLIGPFYTEISLTNAVQVQAFMNLLQNPQADYINVHTNTHGSGVMRAQLRRTDTMTFPVVMDSANETGTVNFKGTAPAVVTVHTIRNEDGSVAAGTVFFDVNYRFPGAATFTGLHIHDAAAGLNGAVTIPMIPTYDAAFATDTGFGDYYNWTPSVPNLASLNDVTKNPENHYVNIHTSVDPAGSARAQLAAAVTAVAAVNVNGVIAANLDKNATSVAPGGLFTIFGTNLAKVATDLSGWLGKTLPTSLNGASVTVGGKAAPLLYVSPTQINAQVPVDVAAGSQPLVVNNGVGPGGPFPLTVAAAAPAIFFSPNAAVLKNSDFSLVSGTNPAHPGDVILVYATGLGQTAPAMSTGVLLPVDAIDNTGPVAATIGGQNAAVIYSIASPGFVGLYQVALTVPAGVSGGAAVVISQGTVKSNSVTIQVQ